MIAVFDGSGQPPPHVPTEEPDPGRSGANRCRPSLSTRRHGVSNPAFLLRLDGSTIFNKAPIGVARHAKKISGAKVLAVGGSLGKGYEVVLGEGIDHCAGMVRGSVTLEDAMSNAHEVLRDATEEALREMGK